MHDTVVAGIGVAGWDAGTDLFLDVARRLADDPGLELRWVGRRSRGAARRLDLDAQLMGVRDRIVWSTDLPSAGTPAVLVIPARTGACRDVAIGRSDPQIPTVCFALPDVADPAASGALDVVRFPDTRSMAERVRSILVRIGQGSR